MSEKQGCPNCESLKQQRDWLAKEKARLENQENDLFGDLHSAVFAWEQAKRNRDEARAELEMQKKVYAVTYDELSKYRAEVKRLTEVNEYITKYPAAPPKV
jgi:chromosome segregation ATPase